MTHGKKSFWHQHSLSISAIIILVIWIVSYSLSRPSTHLGSFFGNAVADWTGMVVTILATKHLYEKGSAESRVPPPSTLHGALQTIREHSLTIFLVITGAAWIALYAAVDSESKWGQVVGNIVSEWTQLFGVVVLTKKLIEVQSKDSNEDVGDQEKKPRVRPKEKKR